MVARTAELVSQELAAIMPRIAQYRRKLEGRKAAVYVGRRLQSLFPRAGAAPVGHGYPHGRFAEPGCAKIRELRQLCDEGTIIVDDFQPARALFLPPGKGRGPVRRGVKERPIAYKLRRGFLRSQPRT